MQFQLALSVPSDICQPWLVSFDRAAHDVGRAVNPQGVEGQIEGGMVQALGQGLMEDYKLEGGHTSTFSFAKYILPTSLDVPQINSILVEDSDQYGPLGVKGVGELSLVPTIPAIMNAVYDAVGVRITNLPATPEKVLMARCDMLKSGMK